MQTVMRPKKNYIDSPSQYNKGIHYETIQTRTIRWY